MGEESIDASTAVPVPAASGAQLTDHLQLALDAGGVGTWRWDAETDLMVLDSTLESLVGLPPGTFPGTFDAWVDLVHPGDRELVVDTLRRVLRDRDSYLLEHRVVWPDGSTHWLRNAGGVTLDDEGRVDGAVACAADATNRVLMQQERERLIAEAIESAERERTHRDRLELLGRINDAIAGAEDRQTVMHRAVHAAVPELGDWCTIYVLPSPTATVPEMELAHIDPEREELGRQLRNQYPYDPDAQIGVPAVIRTGRHEFFSDISDEEIANAELNDAQREALRFLGLRSIIAIPLTKNGRVLGAIQFAMTSDRRRYTDDDVAFARAIAIRIASKLDNIRLSQYRRDIAETLQASLLPLVLPEIDGVEIAVRYSAAGEGVEVGGDFYDVFAIDESRWAVVMGDVCGTGPAAAAMTALARHTIASAAWLGLSPEAVLRHLNTTLRRRSFNSFLTIVYGEIEPSEEGLDLRIALGGHPLPILARADGTVDTCGQAGTLMGVFDDIAVHVTDCTIQPGDTLVLYTDGVTDVAPPYELSTPALLDLVGRATAGTSSAEELATHLDDELAAILPFEQRNDDIALLVLRLAKA